MENINGTVTFFSSQDVFMGSHQVFDEKDHKTG
jgi:hypothetical protein